MTWWVNATTRNTKAFLWCPFGATIGWCYIPFAFSPFIVYGTWLATYVYAGHSPEENMALVRHAYQFTFGAFTDHKLVMPSIDLHVMHIFPALMFLIDSMRALDKFTAVDYLQLSVACTVISFTLSIIRTSVCAAAVLLYTCGKFVKLPVPFYKLAPEQLQDGAGCVNALSEYEYEVNERGTSLEQARKYLRNTCTHKSRKSNSGEKQVVQPLGTSMDQPSSNKAKSH